MSACHLKMLFAYLACQGYKNRKKEKRKNTQIIPALLPMTIMQVRKKHL